MHALSGIHATSPCSYLRRGAEDDDGGPSHRNLMAVVYKSSTDLGLGASSTEVAGPSPRAWCAGGVVGGVVGRVAGGVAGWVLVLLPAPALVSWAATVLLSVVVWCRVVVCLCLGGHGQAQQRG